MKQTAFLLTSLMFIFLTSCGSDKVDSPVNKAYNNTKVPNYVQTYVIETDDNKYRCFDTGSYHGGIWCIPL